MIEGIFRFVWSMTKTWQGTLVACRRARGALRSGCPERSTLPKRSKSSRHGLSGWACFWQLLQESVSPSFGTWYFSVLQTDVWQESWQTHSQPGKVPLSVHFLPPWEAGTHSLTEPRIRCVLGSGSLSPLTETSYHQLPGRLFRASRRE